MIFLAFLTFPLASYATHISGADITYRWISGNTFELNLTLYRDCSGIAAPNNVSVSYSSASCGYNLSVTLNKVPGTGQEISQACSTSVTTCAGGTYPGIQKWEYRGNVTLPAQCTDWRFGYSICCRNCAITTLVFAGGTCAGSPALYVEATLNNVAAPTNSSPVFSNIPVSFLCIGQVFHYNHGAYNTDGDSITYSFITPRSAANTNVTFNAGYTTNSPLSSSPAMSIDASGDITVAPTQTEVGVLAIIVREYRNGVLVGSVIRDMQIWTVPCSNLLPTATGINGTNNFQIVACPGRPLNFTVNSADANASQTVSMSWNYAIPGATFTSSSASRPVGTFSWTPTMTDARPQPYTFTVTVQDNNCPSAGFQTYSYDVLVPPLSATATSTNSRCSTPVNGTATALPVGTGPYQYAWSPGGAATATASNLGPGTYTATITDAYGCTITTTATITAPPPVAIALAAQANVSCRNGNDGAAAITASGGTAPYTYSWSPSGGTASSASGLTAGNYTVTVTDANGCTRTQGVTISQPPALTATTNGPLNLLCFGDANGSASVTPTGGTAPYRYEWAFNGATTAGVTGLGAGSYSVTVTDANGCTTTSSVVVNQPTVLNSSTNTTPSTCGSANGSATVVASGGTGPYQYAWSPGGQTTSTISGIPAGAYSVVITDAHGCTVSDAAGVSNLGGPTVSVSAYTNVACNNGANGSASINVTGGQAPFTYQWSPSGGPGVSATGLQAGNYTITVRDRNNCQSSVVVEITEPVPLSQNIQSTDVACNGGNTGTATVTASGGTTPYAYSWSNGAGNTATASLLVAGNYTVTVTDAHGCTSTQSVAITQPPALTASITSNQPVSCYGGSNATTTVTAGGGTAPYDYSWSPSGGMLSTATGLAAGSYTVTVRDANNCIRSVPVTITQPNALLASVGATTNVSCNGGQNGTASTNVSGGTAPYQYVWSPIGTTTANVTGLAAGSYSVSITDARGCQTVTAAIIQEPPLLQTTVLAPVDVSCYGGNDGSATIVATGGTTPYTYNWSAGGSVSTSANGLPAGSYTVTVTDANACSNTALVVINQPALLSATPTVQNSPLCYGDNSGAASVSVSGGTGPYTYQWSPSGGTDTLASFLPAGIYTVAIRDANGCTSTASATITQPPLLTAAVATVDATCGASNGSASVTPAGGTAPYTYFWSPGNTTTSSISSVPAGSYSVVITDANGCRLIQSVAVSNIGGPTLANGSVVPVLCAGAMTGAATMQVSGGTAPFQYQWSPSGGTGLNATGLAAGTYSFTVRDGNNCVSGLTVTITEPPPLQASASSVNALCAGTGTGAVTVTTSGGVTPYTYAWNAGGHTTANATGLFAGTYAVTITDAHGCTTMVSATVQEPTPLFAANGPVTQISCQGANDGTASVSASGGTSPYSFNWSPITNSSAVASGLSPGNYQVIVSDANGCAATVSIAITEPPALISSINAVTQVLCYGGNNGSATVTASGGTTPYLYQWSPVGTTAAQVNGLSSGNYSVLITDANGCTSSSNVQITEPPMLSGSVLNVIPVSCNGGTDGGISVGITGGAGSYAYQWSPSVSTGPSAGGIGQGQYSVIVTDAHGCTVALSAAVPEPPPLVTTATPIVQVLCYGGQDGSASVSASGGTAPYTYLWSPTGQTTALATGLAAGNYTVVVRDANGCQRTESMQITEPSLLTLSLASTPSTCGSANATANATPGGGTAPYSINWTPGGSSSVSLSGIFSGNYTSVVTDANGCTTSSSILINDLPGPVASLASSTDVSCNDGQDGAASVTISGGSSPITYQWLPTGGSSSSATGLSAGQYSVIITDANNCVQTVGLTISEPALLTSAAAASQMVSCYGLSDGAASVNVTGGTAPYRYLWSPCGSTTSQITNSPAGNYSVVVTDAMGCTTTAAATITEPSLLTASTSATQSTCGNADGSASVIAAGGSGGYTYLWQPGNSAQTTAGGLSAGAYTVTVTDANGCMATAIAAVSDMGAPVIQPGPIIPVNCPGGSDGSTSVTLTGGTAPFQYQWSGGVASGNAVSGLSAGAYSIVVTDGNQCVAVQSFVITEPPPIELSSLSLPVSCHGGNDGALQLTTGGGTPGYSYLWSNGATSQTATMLTTGNYSVVVTDAHGCTSSLSNVITEPDAITASTSSVPVLCNGGVDGAAEIAVNGGTPPYNYEWAGIGVQQPLAVNLRAGIYAVQVTDANGCTRTETVTIAEPAALQSASNAAAVRCNGGSDGSVSVSVQGGTSPYTYQWSTGASSSSVDQLAAGNYSVTVTDDNGCTITGAVAVTEPPALLLSTQGDAWLCIGQSTQIQASAAGGTPGYAFLWSNGAQTANQTVQPAATSTYAVTLTDANGCIAGPQSVVLQLYPALTAIVSNADTLCPGDPATLTAFANGSNGGPYSYTWNTGALGPSITVTPATTTLYTVTVSDQCGSAPVQLQVPVNVVAAPSSNFLPNPASGCVPFTVQYVNNGNLPAGTSYLWDFGDGATSTDRNPAHTFAQPGAYTVRHFVITPLGCASQTLVPAAVNVHPNPIADFIAQPEEVSIFRPRVEMINNSLRSVRWNWDFGDGLGNSAEREPVYTYRDTGNYTIRLVSRTEHGCPDTTYRSIRVKGEFAVYIPNTFTPNNDGINEHFKPLCVGVKDFELWIYDRWGVNIFSTSDLEAGWDGTTKGGNRLCQQDVYVYVIRLKDPEGKTHQYIGHVNLVY